jgi:hypothetical protein
VITTMPIQKRQRSPAVPFIGLARAIARARQLFDRVGRAPLSLPEVANIWGLAPKTSSGLRTIAALRGYGLIENDDATQRIRISDLAAVVFESQEAEVLQRALAAAALNPQLIADYAAKWGVGRPSDAVCIADLQTNHRFTAPAAKSFLQVFDEAMWFLGGGATGVFAAIPQSISPVFPPFSRVKIGDFVQTPTDTANQSAAPRRVVWLADGGRYLYVERSLTRYPVQAVTKIEESPTRFPPIQSNKPPAVKPASETSSDSEGGDWFSFPSIELPRALGYTQDLVNAAGREWVSIIDAANLWYGKPLARVAIETAAGLCDFGLVERKGRGRSRKLRVSERGWRVINSPGTETGLSALREAISKSSLIVHYAREWQDGRPSLENCIKQLNREQGFTAQRASRFLIVFDQCFDIMRATEP